MSCKLIFTRTFTFTAARNRWALKVQLMSSRQAAKLSQHSIDNNELYQSLMFGLRYVQSMNNHSAAGKE